MAPAKVTTNNRRCAMSKSQTAGWASDSPTPAQLKELFAQIGSGRVTRDRLQIFLRGIADQVDGDWFSFTTTTATLRQLRDRNPDIFYSGNDWWLNQPFANKKGKAGQLQLRTSAVPGSFSKNWKEQQELLADGEFVPTVRDLVEGMVAYHRETGQRLSSDYWLRTQDVSSGGFRVDVGFYSCGVLVRSVWGDCRRSYLGVAVARKS